jgi:hypothetical protein
VEVVGGNEGPQVPVSDCLAETLPDGSALAPVGAVLLNTGVGELTLLGGEPAGREGVVGKEVEGEDGGQDGQGTLDDEEPWKNQSARNMEELAGMKLTTASP